MKKILFLSIIMALVATTQAQTLIPLLGSNTSARYDTLTNAGTVYFTTPTNALNANKTGTYSIQWKARNVSGTSTFKVVVLGTINGSDYVPVHGVAGTDGIHCDTLQVTALSPASSIFRIQSGSRHSVTTSTYTFTNAGKFRGLRLLFIGTGTQVTPIDYVYAIND